MLLVLLSGVLTATTASASLYDDLIQRVALEERVDAALLRAVVATESAFDPNAQSSKGAMGLMQLMPGTAKMLGVENPYHPEENLRGGARYLRGLIDRFDRVDYALAGYNAGPENIAKYNGIPPFPETVDYVAKVRENYGRQLSGSTTQRRWRPAITGSATVAPRHVVNLPHVPKKIFVYRDSKGTLVLTDVQPRRKGSGIQTKVYVNSSLSPVQKARIRISSPVRAIEAGRSKDLPG